MISRSVGACNSKCLIALLWKISANVFGLCFIPSPYPLKSRGSVDVNIVGKDICVGQPLA